MEDVCRANHGYETLQLSGTSLGVGGWVSGRVCMRECVVGVRCD